MKKTYNDFVIFLDELVIPSDTGIMVAYRKSALSEIEYLKLFIAGNSLLILDPTESYKLPNLQLSINNVFDLKQAIKQQSDNKMNRISDPIYDKFKLKEEICFSHYENNSFKTGYTVNEFYFKNGDTVVFDV
jgi:hypothetical protein